MKVVVGEEIKTGGVVRVIAGVAVGVIYLGVSLADFLRVSSNIFYLYISMLG